MPLSSVKCHETLRVPSGEDIWSDYGITHSFVRTYNVPFADLCALGREQIALCYRGCFIEPSICKASLCYGCSWNLNRWRVLPSNADLPWNPSASLKTGAGVYILALVKFKYSTLLLFLSVRFIQSLVRLRFKQYPHHIPTPSPSLFAKRLIFPGRQLASIHQSCHA